MVTVNALGCACPLPVVKTLNAIKALTQGDEIETLVDNEIAVQNLVKMAQQKGYAAKSEKVANGKYRVVTIVPAPGGDRPADAAEKKPARRILAVISSDRMGTGSDELGALLMKGFLYALTQQEEIPQCIIFYNSGAKLTVEGSESLEDLRALSSRGVEILTCGTCLDFYGLTERLQVGSVTNMYAIAEKLCRADRVIRP